MIKERSLTITAGHKNIAYENVGDSSPGDSYSSNYDLDVSGMYEFAPMCDGFVPNFVIRKNNIILNFFIGKKNLHYIQNLFVEQRL